jgi:2-polyprenyl-3-methyl-5-hydroxy-6-metoxy-1,4-benzoquinol methylase
MDSSRFTEKILRRWRFKVALKYVAFGSVLDFGCNDKEMKQHLSKFCTYKGVDKGDKIPKEDTYDYILMLAVLEHIDLADVVGTMNLLRAHLSNHGKIILTTPTPMAKKPLDMMANIGLIEKEGIDEHKWYYDEMTLSALARSVGLEIREYKKFQFGFNQLAVLERC